jgi:AcrR family transcriptional regulator
MPRVSPEHLEARRRQILDAARRRFSANGFHATSMQDILAESGLSAGAVYRYFPGKEAIVVAIAEEAIGKIRAAFDGGREDESVLDALGRAISALERHAEQDDLGRLALQVWAEAARSDSLRAHIADAVREARAAVAEGIERRHGPVDDPEGVAAVAIALLPGYLHQKVIVGDVDAERYLRGFATLRGLTG